MLLNTSHIKSSFTVCAVVKLSWSFRLSFLKIILYLLMLQQENQPELRTNCFSKSNELQLYTLIWADDLPVTKPVAALGLTCLLTFPVQTPASISAKFSTRHLPLPGNHTGYSRLGTWPMCRTMMGMVHRLFTDKVRFMTLWPSPVTLTFKGGNSVKHF